MRTKSKVTPLTLKLPTSILVLIIRNNKRQQISTMKTILFNLFNSCRRNDVVEHLTTSGSKGRISICDDYEGTAKGLCSAFIARETVTRIHTRAMHVTSCVITLNLSQVNRYRLITVVVVVNRSRSPGCYFRRSLQLDC